MLSHCDKFVVICYPNGLLIMKNKRINVRATETEIKELNRIADRIGVSAAVIVRSAVQNKIKQLKELPREQAIVALAS